jgi:hypothetical protein
MSILVERYFMVDKLGLPANSLGTGHFSVFFEDRPLKLSLIFIAKYR